MRAVQTERSLVVIAAQLEDHFLFKKADEGLAVDLIARLAKELAFDGSVDATADRVKKRFLFCHRSIRKKR